MTVTIETKAACPFRAKCNRLSYHSTRWREYRVTPGQVYNVTDALLGSDRAKDGWLQVRNDVGVLNFYSATFFEVFDDGVPAIPKADPHQREQPSSLPALTDEVKRNVVAGPKPF